MLILNKSACVIELQAELANLVAFFLKGTVFLLERMTNYNYLNLDMCVYFLKNK